jgi:hypothetical protein
MYELFNGAISKPTVDTTHSTWKETESLSGLFFKIVSERLTSLKEKLTDLLHIANDKRHKIQMVRAK